MMARLWRAGPAVVFLAVACSKPPAPAPTTPVAAAPDLARAADSIAAARRDSAAAAARADSLARAERERVRADSVRMSVQQVSADTAPKGAPAGLAAADSALLAEPIHFDYDRADIGATDQAQLDRKVAVLAAHARLEIRIAGNCDERGSTEYNLALGERRAAAAKRYLAAHGVAATRVEIVSYGKEHPLDPGHSEGAWAKNRRDDFVVTKGAR
ncbi:MAG TPA: peptidoglycan-associated lipoprotein Pal [Gemmatimonadales bacterium]|nr:peptidoglycan-associated lipoprotein Pal [Gemmatimonadales bacterium]